MTPSPKASDWRKEFGLSDRVAPTFFPDAASLVSEGVDVPQAHTLRRAFELLELDGVLCQNNAPVVFFKEFDSADPERITGLLRRFWNQGLSPLLVVIMPPEVQVYSSLAEPPRPGEPLEARRRLVARLNRAAEAGEIRQFALAVESGELFRAQAKSFDPAKRVDRELLRNLAAARAQLSTVSAKRLDPRLLDNLLCRLVFTSYLFDRSIIDEAYLQSCGISGVTSLRELIAGSRDEAVERLYSKLFKRLGEDFNGDLFSDDLDAEAESITDKHLRVLTRFLSGADVRTGQGAFWPYDFSAIPIETISAIYEHFLKSADPEGKKKKGAFYTPRFLAEVALDTALAGGGDLLGSQFLDPACGSGIFLVGLFNRLAEEWTRDNAGATYAVRAKALLAILKENLFGVDENPTACRIAAFSLYLALLDQLRPSQIQELQKRKKFLPRLVFTAADTDRTGTIFCGDYFTLPREVEGRRFNYIVGNPPWASAAGVTTEAETWCESRKLPTANRQIALAFVWKAAEQVAKNGRVCFVLPGGVLFNHHDKALAFQRAWFEQHTVDVVLNLSDYQRFLFDEAEFPAVVVRYRPGAANARKHRVAYLSPKTDWSVSQAELIVVAPEDRTEIPTAELLADLRSPTAPLPWKVRFWSTPRDQKLLDRLSLFPRLSEITRQSKEKTEKRWIAGQGFKPENGDRKPDSKQCPWGEDQLFLEATTKAIDLFVIESDGSPLAGRFPWLHRLPTALDIFEPPHVLVTKGFAAVAFSDFPVVFRHALQGIHGPKSDRALLVFLAAYLCSPLARFFLFHTTSSWGISRQEVHLEELLTAPFPLPEQTLNPERARQIVEEVVTIIDAAMRRAGKLPVDRVDLVRVTRDKVFPLVFEYFDLDEDERSLVEDTNNIVIHSTRPSKASSKIPTLAAPTPSARAAYVQRLCRTLNGWAKGGRYSIEGRALVSVWSGVGAVELRKLNGVPKPPGLARDADAELLDVLDRLRKAYRKQLGAVELLHGLKVFDQDTLYLFKPLRLRHWSQTAALNDADSIASSILMAGGGGS